MTGKCKETSDLSSWKLMDYEPTGSPYRTDIGPLHVGYSYVTWSVCRSPSRGIRICPRHMSWLLWNLMPVLGCLVQV